jgi:hypothetical protein
MEEKKTKTLNPIYTTPKSAHIINANIVLTIPFPSSTGDKI